MQTDIIQREIRRLARGVGTTTIPKRLLCEIPFFWDEKLNAEAEKIYKNRRRESLAGWG